LGTYKYVSCDTYKQVSEVPISRASSNATTCIYAHSHRHTHSCAHVNVCVMCAYVCMCPSPCMCMCNPPNPTRCPCGALSLALLPACPLSPSPRVLFLCRHPYLLSTLLLLPSPVPLQPPLIRTHLYVAHAHAYGPLACLRALYVPALLHPLFCVVCTLLLLSYSHAIFMSTHACLG
jgi:hypothetical protein